MWFCLLLLIFPLIRYNKLLRIYFQGSLYKIGVQFGNTIYTPVCDVYSDFRWFDVVFFKKSPGHLYGHRLLYQEQFDIPLSYVPVGKTLLYKINGVPSEHMYLEGTPFTLSNGELTLYRRESTGRMGSFRNIEVARSIQWPIINNE